MTVIEAMCPDCKAKSITHTYPGLGVVTVFPCNCQENRRHLKDVQEALEGWIERCRLAGLNKLQASFTLDGLLPRLIDAKVPERAKAALEQGRWPFLHGPAGSGKTHVSVALLTDWMKRYELERGLRVKWGRLLIRIQDTFSGGNETMHSIIRQLEDVAFLVIDDIGKGRDSTDWALSVLHEVIDARYEAKAPTVITSNLSFYPDRAVGSRGELESKLDPDVDARTESRLLGMLDAVEMPDLDFRELERAGELDGK